MPYSRPGSSVVERRTVPKGSLREKSLRRQYPMAVVYILKSLKIDNWHYVGSCTDLATRLKQHCKGSVRSTKNKRPLILLHQEIYPSVSMAKKREYFLKSPKGYLEKKKIIRQFKPG